MPFYCLTEDLPLLAHARENKSLRKRCALIAPLDPFLWDKKLIRRLFGFDYTWEIYTPETKRKFGAYVLPLLYGEGFAGRAEVVNDRKNHTLVIRNIWYEPSFQKTKAFASASKKCMKRFAVFNACKVIQWPEGEFTYQP